MSFLPYFQKQLILLFTSLFVHSQIIVQEKYDLIFQNAIITVIIFVVNSPVDFVSALMDQGNYFLIFFSSFKKIHLFQLIHSYRLWHAIIQSMTIPQTMLHKWSVMTVTAKQEKHTKMRWLLIVIHFAFSFIYIKWFKNHVIIIIII